MRVFASGFLQIPPRDGHPCRQLTVPTAKPVVDFHHQVITHAGRTQQKANDPILESFAFLLTLFLVIDAVLPLHRIQVFVE